MENRLQIIKNLETLLKTTRACGDINISYGYAKREYSEPNEKGKRYLINVVFHESERELSLRDDPSEEVRI